MNIVAPDNFQSIRVRFLLNGWEVDVFSVPVYRSAIDSSDSRRRIRVVDGHTWSTLIINPRNMLDRHEIMGCESYRDACRAAHQKTEELNRGEHHTSREVHRP